MVEWALGWLAPAATMIAAMMTAANAGARVTGWGFVIFAMGSIAWSLTAIFTDQRNLLLTNLFLTAVNVIGVWRWLGRQAKHEDGGMTAARKSRHACDVPTLFSAAASVGADIVDTSGAKLAVVVDLMMTRDQRSIAYVVIAQYGGAGIGETLRAVEPARLEFEGKVARTTMSAGEIDALPALKADDWPAALPEAGDAA